MLFNSKSHCCLIGKFKRITGVRLIPNVFFVAVFVNCIDIKLIIGSFHRIKIVKCSRADIRSIRFRNTISAQTVLCIVPQIIVVN